MPSITVLKSDITTAKNRNGKPYNVCEFAYKDDTGKVKSMRIFGFGNSEAAYKVATAAVPGDVVDAVFQQNDKGYWEFASLTATDKKEDVTAVAATPATSGKSNWETSDERAARQLMIVRQSNLKTAVAMFECNKAKATPEDVIKVALMFEEFVMAKNGEVE